MVSEKKSAAGAVSTCRPAASASTTAVTRGLFSTAISAAIQPPIELPMTVTPSRSSWSSRFTYSWPRPPMVARPSGRGVPPKPGCSGDRRSLRGVSTWACWEAASRVAKLSTDCGPAPPCRTR